MATNPQSTERFYSELFSADPFWSTPYANPDEARRWAKIGECLSDIPQPRVHGVNQRLRIFDVGCGRGWLTRLASIYGACDGIDPVAGSVETARRYFPDLKFSVGTTADVLRAPDFKPYDVVISSEVIEHVVDKDSFVDDLARCIVPNGHVIITTPRGEEFKKWKRLGYAEQPVEAWVTENDLRAMFERHGFVAVFHDRVYLNDRRAMSFLHRLCVSRKLERALGVLGLGWIFKGLQYKAGFYQVWCFRRTR